MRIIWDEADVKPGLQVKKPGTIGRGCVIGYEVGFARPTDRTLVLVDLNDGLVIFREKDANETAAHLTTGEYVPIAIVEHFEATP